MVIDVHEYLFGLSIMALFGYQLWQTHKIASSENTSPLIIDIYKRQRRLYFIYIFITGIFYIALESTSFELLFFLIYSLTFAMIIFEIVPLKVKLLSIETKSSDLFDSEDEDEDLFKSDPLDSSSENLDFESFENENNN